jgi:anaerobic magnesium-protoporphyrin IX monomethyl ester cyclase
MRLLIINPPRVAGYPVVREERFEHKDIGSVYPPLSLLYCASVARRAGWDVEFIDANGQDLPLVQVQERIRASQAQACLIRSGFDTQDEDIKVLEAAKAKGMLTLMRLKIVGDTPWLLKEFMQQHACVDGFFLDEPECLLEGVLKAVEAGQGLQACEGLCLRQADGSLLDLAKPSKLMMPDELPLPAYDLVGDLSHYHTGVMDAPFTVVQTSRGCPFTCSFCAFGKLAYRKRDLEKVIEELQWLKDTYGLRHFLFFDDVLTLDPKRTERLMDMMIARQLNLSWVCCTRANCVSKPMLEKMKQAGCHEIAFGIESGSDAVLDGTTKGVTKDAMRQAARWCHEVGILFYGLAIIGLPGETRQSVEETIDFINELEPFYTQFGYCVPFPNTETYDWYESRGYLATKDWSQFFPLAEKPIIRTEALSADELVALRRRLYLKTMLHPRRLLRAIHWTDPLWNLRAAGKFLSRVLKVAGGKPVR